MTYNPKHYPSALAGKIPGTNESWSIISQCLTKGSRGLPGGDSLARLIARHFPGARPGSLSLAQIEVWIREHFDRTGRYPTVSTKECIPGTAERWPVLNNALYAGSRGLPGGTSLARFIDERFGRVRRQSLTTELIKTWIDSHRSETGRFPTSISGAIPGTTMKWANVDCALTSGNDDLPGGSSLAKFIAAEYNTRYRNAAYDVPVVRGWVVRWKELTGHWPTRISGPLIVHIPDTVGVTWRAINRALAKGNRGLPRTGNLTGFIRTECLGLTLIPADLTLESVRDLVLTHYARTQQWPCKNTGVINNAGETWYGIDQALIRGERGLPGGISLRIFVATCGAFTSRWDARTNGDDLDEARIIELAKEHRKLTGQWPSANAGPIAGTDATWGSVNYALRKGARGLPGGTSLHRLLREEVDDRPDLSVELIRTWMLRHKESAGDWPNRNSGLIPGTIVTWRNVDAALIRGGRGLPRTRRTTKENKYLGGMYRQGLTSFRRMEFGEVKSGPLTLDQVRSWVMEHKSRTGKWPNRNSGLVEGTEERWENIIDCFRSEITAKRRHRKGRGIPSGLSFYEFTISCGREAPTVLSIVLIKRWIVEHHEATGKWPTVNSSRKPAKGESWMALAKSLAKGQRGLPAGIKLHELVVQCGGTISGKGIRNTLIGIEEAHVP